MLNKFERLFISCVLIMMGYDSEDREEIIAEMEEKIGEGIRKN